MFTIIIVVVVTIVRIISLLIIVFYNRRRHGRIRNAGFRFFVMVGAKMTRTTGNNDDDDDDDDNADDYPVKLLLDVSRYCRNYLLFSKNFLLYLKFLSIVSRSNAIRLVIHI